MTSSSLRSGGGATSTSSSHSGSTTKGAVPVLLPPVSLERGERGVRIHAVAVVRVPRLHSPGCGCQPAERTSAYQDPARSAGRPRGGAAANPATRHCGRPLGASPDDHGAATLPSETARQDLSSSLLFNTDKVGKLKQVRVVIRKKGKTHFGRTHLSLISQLSTPV